MNDRFLDDDFLLSEEVGRRLFHDVAAKAPIVDLHNHLSPADIADDRAYETLTDLWLADDHYKWRAMRQAGLEEDLITGDADPWDRFSAWAATVPGLLRNPLYIWTHLELRRVFGIDLPLTPATAPEIWHEANRQLHRWPARTLLARFDVAVLATTDDPADGLAAHRRLAREPTPDLVMIPTFRPDPAHRHLHDPSAWNTWVDRLAAASGQSIEDLPTLLAALTVRHRSFAEAGGRSIDNGLGHLPDIPRQPVAADAVVRRARSGIPANVAERHLVMLEVVALAARLAHEDDSVMQLHLGPRRDVSPRVLQLAGHDAGGDAIGDDRQGPGLIRFLGDCERGGTLPRTILYNVNPADNALFATVAGAFNRPRVRSLVQWGPPWWFNDHEGGMRRHLDSLSEVGRLADFVGMHTDSRSILSMTRHELFRRVLCDVIGRDVDEGRIPPDADQLASVVHDVCVGNARDFYGLSLSISKSR